MTETLEQVLSGPLKLEFQTFVVKSLCSESLEFYEAVESYRNIQNQSERSSAAQTIYDTFVRPGSDNEINIEHPTRKTIQSKLVEARDDLFNDAQTEIASLLSMDVLPRFLRSRITSPSPSTPDPSSNYNEIELVPLSTEDIQPDHPLPFTRANWLRKTKELAPVAVSVSFSTVIVTLNGLIQLIFIGRISDVASASAGLANFYIAVTAYSFCFGVLGAQDTLSSQAFGAKNMHRVSIVFQRSIMIMMVVFLPISLAWSFTEPILIALGQDKVVSKMTASFVLIYLPSLPALLVNDCLKRYLISQGIASPPLYSALIANTIAVLAGFVMILHTRLGFYGMPIALGLSNYLTLAILTFWTVKQGLHVATWRRITIAELLNFHDNLEFLKLGIPGALMICAEWIGIEVHGLMAGWLGVTSLATQAIIFNTNYAAYSLAFGGAVSACVSVGNDMGAGRFREGVLAYLVAIFNYEVLAGLLAFTLIVLRYAWGYIFTKVPEVIALIAKVIPLFALFILADCAGAVGGGTIRGVGEQTKAAIANLFSYYCIGIPLGYWLAFPSGLNWGLVGLWVAINAASYTSAVLTNAILVFGDWEKWAVKAKQRSHALERPSDLESLESDVTNSTTTNLDESQIELSDLYSTNIK